LSRAFNIGIRDWHWLKENPVQKITKPKENKPKERYLEEVEIKNLLDVCRKSKSPHLFSFVVLALATGARKGEILGLKWSDIDFNRATATFRDTKNSETRTVFLSEFALNTLRTGLKKNIELSAFVFPNMDGKRPADIREAWERAVQQAGLGKDVTIHSLRHTVASHLSMRSFSTLEIGKILGHKTLSQLKRYSHLSVASTATALNTMNDIILGSFENAS